MARTNDFTQLETAFVNSLCKIMVASFPPTAQILFRESLAIHFSARVGVPEVIALGSCVLGFSRPRVRDVTCPRKQVPIQARDEIVFSPRFPRFSPVWGRKDPIVSASSSFSGNRLFSECFVVFRPISRALSVLNCGQYS